jgi:hypothetical protein
MGCDDSGRILENNQEATAWRTNRSFDSSSDDGDRTETTFKNGWE